MWGKPFLGECPPRTRVGGSCSSQDLSARLISLMTPLRTSVPISDLMPYQNVSKVVTVLT